MTADPHADLRAMLEERDKLAEQLAARPRAEVYVTAASHNEAMRALERERDALKAEVERLRAKPVTPEQLFSSSKVIWEGWVRARDEERGCVLDLFNGRVDRSRYVRVVEADQPQKPAHHKWPADPVEPAKPADAAALKEKLNEIIAKDRIALAKAEAAADAAWRERLIAFEEHRMRCEIAARVLCEWISLFHANEQKIQQWGMYEGVHDIADALIAEARRRKEAGK